MEFHLLVPNHRLKWLPWIMAAVFIGVIALLSLAPGLGFAVLISFPVAALVASFFPKLSERLFWQPMQAWLAPDGVAWRAPEASQPVSYPFVELRAYRFRVGKGVTDLLLWPISGEKVTVRCRYTVELAAFQQAFTQAVNTHNRACAGEPVAQEEEPLVTFFKSPAATKVLLGLLAVLAIGVGCGVARGLPPAAYLVPALLLLPYLLIWAYFYYQRQ
jgi:hypothetical protein